MGQDTEVTARDVLEALEWITLGVDGTRRRYLGAHVESVRALHRASAFGLVAIGGGLAEILPAGRATLAVARAYHARYLTRKEGG